MEMTLWKNFNLYVPGDFQFGNYFLPRIKNPQLEFFPVNARRYGVQRQGNNHLVVFLDFCLKKSPYQFIEIDETESGVYNLIAPMDVEMFNRLFGLEKEVSVFSVSYHSRMSAIAWKLLIDIAEDERIMAEDDSGNFVGGPQCVRDLKHLFGPG